MPITSKKKKKKKIQHNSFLYNKWKFNLLNSSSINSKGIKSIVKILIIINNI